MKVSHMPGKNYLKRRVKMNDDEWTEKEIRQISDDDSEFEERRDKKRTSKLSRQYDTRIFLIFLLLLLPLLSVELIARESHRRQVKEAAMSAQWRCKKCYLNCYSECPDWRGDFYCRRCGTKKGE